MKKFHFLFILLSIVVLFNSCHHNGGDPVPVVDSLKIGLVAYYPFNNNANDESGNGNNGTPNDLVSVSDRFGIANRAFQFNGSSSYIQVKDNTSLRLSNTSFTINSWLKLDSYNSSYGSQVIDKRIAGAGNGWNVSITGHQFFQTGQGALGLLSFNEGGSDLTRLTVNTVSIGSWHMVTTVFNYKTHTLIFYIDGNIDSFYEGFSSPNGSVSADMFIGKDNPDVTDAYFIKGLMDDIYIYDRALSANDIKKLYVLSH